MCHSQLILQAGFLLCLLWWFLMTGFPANQPTVDVFGIMWLSELARKGKNTHSHAKHPHTCTHQSQDFLISADQFPEVTSVCLFVLDRRREETSFLQPDLTSQLVSSSITGSIKREGQREWGGGCYFTFIKKKMESVHFRPDQLFVSSECLPICLIQRKITSLWNNVRAEKHQQGLKHTHTHSSRLLWKSHIMSCEEESDAGKSGFSRVNSLLSPALCWANGGKL